MDTLKHSSTDSHLSSDITHGDQSETPNKPKRKYSKAGCKECKRRKMKCDEGKPVCWHCRRLEKPCIYDPVKQSKRMKTSSNVTYSRTSYGENKDSVYTNDPRFYAPNGQVKAGWSNPPFASYDSPLALPNILNHAEPHSSAPLNSPLRPYIGSYKGHSAPLKIDSPASLPGSVSLNGSSSSDSPPLPLDPLMNIPQYFNDDGFINNANIMAQNLNDLLTARLDEAMDSSKLVTDKSLEGSQLPFMTGNQSMNGTANFTQEHLNTWNSEKKRVHEFSHIISYNMKELKTMPQVSLSAFDLGNPHQLYLEYFYKDFALVIFPFAPSESENPMRDVLLTLGTKNAYLMSAILACGARSVNKLKPAPQHERIYLSYLSSCLAALSKVLNSPKKKLLENVEPLLLTILLLTSDNASSKNQSWRAHLRGAKDLLLMCAQAKKEPNMRASSLVFAVCTVWYISFEILAGAGGAPLGGTFENEDEMDLLISQEDEEMEYLKSLNIIRDKNTYNVFAGFNTAMLIHLRDTVKLLNRVKKEAVKGENKAVSIHEAIDLISNLEKQIHMCLVDPSAIVPESHYLHPSSKMSPPPGADILPESAIGIARLPDGSSKAFCWYDISQQSFARGSMLSLVTKVLNLPKESPFVQELVHDVVSVMHFLDSESQPSGYSVFMMQPAMLEAAMFCIDPQDQRKIEKFFNIVKDLGVGSAEYVLKRIHKRWDFFRRQKSGDLNFGISEDEDDKVDIVTY